MEGGDGGSRNRREDAILMGGPVSVQCRGCLFSVAILSNCRGYLVYTILSLHCTLSLCVSIHLILILRWKVKAADLQACLTYPSVSFHTPVPYTYSNLI